MKKIAILGSTGSIGTQTLDVCDITGEYSVDALTAHSNVSLLENQIRKYKPRLACMTDEKSAADLKTRVRDMPVRVLSGADGLCECAAETAAETVVTAFSGVTSSSSTRVFPKNGPPEAVIMILFKKLR